MELADKSWGDLICRLPIIVLEDSTLHPDFGFLVWLMVAESKVWVYVNSDLIKHGVRHLSSNSNAVII